MAVDRTAADIAGTGSALVTLVEALVRELDNKGIVSRTAFRQSLLDGAASARAESTLDPAMPRRDLMLMEMLARNLDDPKPREPWRPQVIPGGLS